MVFSYALELLLILPSVWLEYLMQSVGSSRVLCASSLNTDLITLLELSLQLTYVVNRLKNITCFGVLPVVLLFF